MAPSAGVGKKLISASRINRIPHAGCHSSGWYAEKDKHTLTLVSNLPDGVRNRMEGGLKGYSGGSRILPWLEVRKQECLLMRKLSHIQ
jgi:hypothetical protein